MIEPNSEDPILRTFVLHQNKKYIYLFYFRTNVNLEELNPWWRGEEIRDKLAPAAKRKLYSSISSDINRRQIQVLVGLRRVGKTTLFFQLINELVKAGRDPLTVCYVSFDEPELESKGIDGFLKEYSILTKKDYRRENIILFLDEVQKAKNWVAIVKLLYDNFPNIKFLLSGSASLNLFSEAKKNLAGRTIYYELKPLSFSEYLEFRKIRYDRERISLYREILEREFQSFLIRPFPEIVFENDTSFIKKYIRDAVIDPILFKDAPKHFPDVDSLLLEHLLLLMLSNPGQYLSFDELAKETRRGKATLYRAFSHLEASFLLRRVYNYRPSIRAASRKLQRVYAYHPSVALPYGIPIERYAENLVLSEIGARFYWKEGEKEIDFITDSTPVEVKYRERVSDADLKWTRYFTTKYITKRAFVITKNTEKEVDGIKLIPLWQFCLTGLYGA